MKYFIISEEFKKQLRGFIEDCGANPDNYDNDFRPVELVAKGEVGIVDIWLEGDKIRKDLPYLKGQNIKIYIQEVK